VESVKGGFEVVEEVGVNGLDGLSGSSSVVLSYLLETLCSSDLASWDFERLCSGLCSILVAEEGSSWGRCCDMGENDAAVSASQV